MLGIRFKFGILCKAAAFTRILFKILYSWSTFRYFGPFNNQSLACYIPVPFPCHTSSPAVSTAKITEVDLMARLSFDPQKALCRNNPFQFWYNGQPFHQSKRFKNNTTSGWSVPWIHPIVLHLWLNSWCRSVAFLPLYRSDFIQLLDHLDYHSFQRMCLKRKASNKRTNDFHLEISVSLWF